MKDNNILIKSILSCLLIWCLFSVSFSATTQKWRDIFNQLEDDWRTDDETRVAMKDLWYNANEYLWTWESNLKVIVADSNTKSTWWDIIDQLEKDWRTDEEIKQAIEDLLTNSRLYISTNNLNSTSHTEPSSSLSKYISRSCKPYNIEYNSSLNIYTSPDLNKKEYFVNIDYLKRYVDSKNAQNAECYTNRSWITTSYTDTSNSKDRYIAPNWKIYFISELNWLYTSNELSFPKSFSTIDELKNYIKTRNPLISMWTTPTQNTIVSNYTQTENNPETTYEIENNDNAISDLRKELWI